MANSTFPNETLARKANQIHGDAFAKYDKAIRKALSGPGLQQYLEELVEGCEERTVDANDEFIGPIADEPGVEDQAHIVQQAAIKDALTNGLVKFFAKRK